MSSSTWSSLSSSSLNGGMELSHISWATIPESVLSVCMCSLVFSSLVYSREFRSPPLFGVLCLSMSDCLQALSTLIAQIPASGACQVAGFFAQIADLAGNLFLLFIAVNLFTLYRWYLKDTIEPTSPSTGSGFTTSKWHYIAALLISLTAIVTAIVPLTGALGIEYAKGIIGTCWISTDPLMARFVCSVSIFYFVLFSIHPLLPMARNITGQRVLKPTQFLYPLTMFVIWVPCTVNRIYESVDDPNKITEYMQAVLLPLWGTIDSVIYIAYKCHFRAYFSVRYPSVLSKLKAFGGDLYSKKITPQPTVSVNQPLLAAGHFSVQPGDRNSASSTSSSWGSYSNA
ncbi:hypothetical protein Pelo_8415 [Pelomyxa schiedti]|nr:hypothetical protein Pelo_8415 [Pelomyxa schiedti]